MVMGDAEAEAEAEITHGKQDERVYCGHLNLSRLVIRKKPLIHFSAAAVLSFEPFLDNVLGLGRGRAPHFLTRITGKRTRVLGPRPQSSLPNQGTRLYVVLPLPVPTL